jgi:hypothetical protein
LRKTIFDLLSENFDVAYEIKTIWQLFIKIAKIDISDRWATFANYLSILEFVNTYSFTNWKSRNRCISPLDMMNRLGIDDKFVDGLCSFSDKVLLVLEFIVNMLALCKIVIKESHFPVNQEYQILNENIITFIEHFGYETYSFEEEEQVVIIEKNPAAISAAEISEPEIAKKIIQYNHYTLKGNIDLKKDIIVALANDLEPHRNELEKIDKSLAKDGFFMFNNLNLRHNNIETDSKWYKPFVAKMDNNTLEHWYDETYQMILLSKLLLDNVGRKDKVSVLKKNIGETQDEPEIGNI